MSPVSVSACVMVISPRPTPDGMLVGSSNADRSRVPRPRRRPTSPSWTRAPLSGHWPRVLSWEPQAERGAGHERGRPRADDGGRRRAAGARGDAPMDIPAPGWKDVLARTKAEAKTDNVSLLA